MNTLTESLRHYQSPPLIHVDSSSIAAVGYNPLARILLVQFHNGGRYRYDEVPPEVFEHLLSAESIGQFFLRVIRGNYTFTRLDR